LARPPKVLIKHASGSRALMHAHFDMRSTVGKAYRARVEALTSHIGGDPSTVQRTLVDQAARLHLLTLQAWDELTRSGAFHRGMPTPANDAYRRAAADERSVLMILGLERKAKEIQDLADYQAKAKRLPFKGRTLDVTDAEEVR